MQVPILRFHGHIGIVDQRRAPRVVSARFLSDAVPTSKLDLYLTGAPDIS